MKRGEPYLSKGGAGSAAYRLTTNERGLDSEDPAHRCLAPPRCPAVDTARRHSTSLLPRPQNHQPARLELPTAAVGAPPPREGHASTFDTEAMARSARLGPDLARSPSTAIALDGSSSLALARHRSPVSLKEFFRGLFFTGPFVLFCCSADLFPCAWFCSLTDLGSRAGAPAFFRFGGLFQLLVQCFGRGGLINWSKIWSASDVGLFCTKNLTFPSFRLFRCFADLFTHAWFCFLTDFRLFPLFFCSV
jgi:hypothetical protein